MKKKPILFIASLIGAFLLAISFIYLQKSDLSLVENTENDQVSGAYEALNFFGARTVYPNQELPEKAFYAAWEHSKKMPKMESNERSDIDPWEAIGPHNRGGRTLALEYNPQNPNTLWIGTASGGIWRSYSAGIGVSAWEYVETGFPILGVGTIAFPPGDSSTIYLGTGEVYNVQAAGTGAAYRSTRGSYGMGILKSTDGGETWTQSLDWSYDQNRGVWAIKIDPNNPNMVYAGTTHGVYKSIDAGENWDQVFNISMANDLVIHPNNPDLLVVGVGNLGSPNRGIYRSTDGGQNWEQITDNLPADFQGKIQLNYAPSQPDILYASIGNGFSQSNGASWLCRSEDFGASWTVVSQTDYSKWQGWFAHDVDVSATDPNKIVAIGIDVWKSDDGGQNLIQETNGGIGDFNAPIGDPGDPNTVHSDCHDVKFHPTEPNIVYVASDGGVHRSTDGGQTFQLCTGGLQNCQFYNGFSNSNQDANFCMGGLQDNGTIVWTGDLRWQVVLGGDGSWTGIDPQDDDTFFASWQNLNVRRFTNGGAQQNSMNIPTLNNVAFISPYVIYPGNGAVMYAGNGGVSVTTNGGDSWALTNGGNLLDNGNPVLSMDVATDNPSVVYAGTAPTTLFGGTRGRIFVTISSGGTWIDRTGILPDRFPMDITVDPSDEGTAYVAFSGYGSGHVFKTTDYGQNWVDISGDLPDVPTNAIAVDPLYPNNIYVGNDLGVYVSIDGGITWETFQMGLNTATMIFDLKISNINRKLRAATHGSGAYQRDLIEDNVATNDLSNVVSEINIYPNPAKDFAKISFNVLQNEGVIIRVVDVLGKLVQNIDNRSFVTGVNEVTIDLNRMSSGNYYVQFMTESGMTTKKLSVIK
jgi:photosystem II stability/assembly factor-like uncharacterized protein